MFHPAILPTRNCQFLSQIVLVALIVEFYWSLVTHRGEKEKQLQTTERKFCQREKRTVCAPKDSGLLTSMGYQRRITSTINAANTICDRNLQFLVGKMAG